VIVYYNTVIMHGNINWAVSCPHWNTQLYTQWKIIWLVQRIDIPIETQCNIKGRVQSVCKQSLCLHFGIQTTELYSTWTLWGFGGQVVSELAFHLWGRRFKTRTQSSCENSKSQRSAESRWFSPGTPVSSHRESWQGGFGKKGPQ
jgi:hypothetical protein